MTTVNGQEADPGCFIAGHRGQYAIDELAAWCESFGLTVKPADDPRHWRAVAEAETPEDSPDPKVKPEDAWERHHWAADALEQQLQDVTEGGYWEWRDGEFFLVQTEIEATLYVPIGEEYSRSYDEVWQDMLDGATDGTLDYEDLDRGERAYQFRITIHYTPDEEEWT